MNHIYSYSYLRPSSGISSSLLLRTTSPSRLRDTRPASPLLQRPRTSAFRTQRTGSAFRSTPASTVEPSFGHRGLVLNSSERRLEPNRQPTSSGSVESLVARGLSRGRAASRIGSATREMTSPMPGDSQPSSEAASPSKTAVGGAVGLWRAAHPRDAQTDKPAAIPLVVPLQRSNGLGQRRATLGFQKLWGKTRSADDAGAPDDSTEATSWASVKRCSPSRSGSRRDTDTFNSPSRGGSTTSPVRFNSPMMRSISEESRSQSRTTSAFKSPHYAPAFHHHRLHADGLRGSGQKLISPLKFRNRRLVSPPVYEPNHSAVESDGPADDDDAPTLAPQRPQPGWITVVFDLDETLCNNRHPGRLAIRPGCLECLQSIASLRDDSEVNCYVEVILWTASVECVARPVVFRIDPAGSIFDHLIFRDSRWYRESGYTKDLRLLGREMSHVLVVENSPQSVVLNRRQAIIVKGYVGGAGFVSPMSLPYHSTASPNDPTLRIVANIVSAWALAVGKYTRERLLTAEPAADPLAQPLPLHVGIIGFLQSRADVSPSNELVIPAASSRTGVGRPDSASLWGSQTRPRTTLRRPLSAIARG